MITLRNGVAAFLQNGGNYLLMKRADNRKTAPGVWSGVGGHIEPHEIYYAVFSQLFKASVIGHSCVSRGKLKLSS